MANGIESIVQVQIDRLTKFPTRQGFGVALILDVNSVQTDRVNSFTDPSEMLDLGFSESDEAYKCALSLMSQNPKPELFKVGRRDANVAQVVTVTPVVVNNFSYQVTINGLLHTFLSDADATATEIVAGLIAAINGGAQAANVTASGTTTLIVTSDVPGQGFSYSVGTNLSAVLTTPNRGPSSELDEVINVDDDFYCLLSTDRSALAIKQLAAAIEAKVKVFGIDSNEADARDLSPSSDTGTSVLAQLKALNYDRTFYMWSNDLDHYAVAAMFGKLLPKDPGNYTAKFKNLNGVAADDQLTPTQRNNIVRQTTGATKNGNIYVTIGGIAIVEEGTVVSGEFLDIIIGTDWIQSRIQENVYALLVNEDKVPMDNGGIQAVVLRVEQILKQAVDRRILRGGDDAPTVSAPDVNDLDQGDRANRFLDGIEFEGFYAGAVHKTRIRGRISV